MNIKEKILVPENNVKIGRTKDESLMCEIKIPKTCTCEEARWSLIKYFSYIMDDRHNVQLTIRPDERKIYLTGLSNCPEKLDDLKINGEQYTYIKEVSLEGFEKLYDSEMLKNAPVEKMVFLTTMSVVDTVIVCWLRMKLMVFGFKFNGNSYTWANKGLDTMNQMQESIEQMPSVDTESRFWDRMWALNKDLDIKKGGAKYG